MIPLCIPNISGNEGAYLQRCVETTFVSSVGEFVDKFEDGIAAATGANFAVATSAGTTALHTALHACGVGPGDHVIIPSLTFIATANAVSHCHGIPIIVDVEEDGWCLDPELVASLLSEQCQRDKSGVLRLTKTGGAVKAILPVFTMGMPAKMDQFRALADEYDLALIADAAAAIGASYHGKNLAFTGADLIALSFNGNKLITCGGGGALIGMDKEVGVNLKHLTSTARVGRVYDHDMVGFNYRMTNLQAAVGFAQLERLDEFIGIKDRISKSYEDGFADIPSVSNFPASDYCTSSKWLSGVYLHDASLETVAKFRDHLQANGIEARPFWKPIDQQTPYLDCPTVLAGRSAHIWSRVQPLPSSTNLTRSEQDLVIAAVRSFFAGSHD